MGPPPTFVPETRLLGTGSGDGQAGGARDIRHPDVVGVTVISA
jgi:hypothetical protein